MGQRPRETESGSDYLSYLLRLWQEAEEAVEIREGPVWRASLTSSRTGERMGFASLEDLVTYLEERMGTGPDSEGIQDGSKGNSESKRWTINR